MSIPEALLLISLRPSTGMVMLGICVVGFVWLCWLVAGGRKQIRNKAQAADAALAAGNYAEAIRLCDVGLATERKMRLRPDDITAVMLVIRSEASQKLGKNDEALEAAAYAFGCLCCVQTNCAQLAVLDRLGNLLVDVRQDQRAIPVLEAAVALGKETDHDVLRNSSRLQHLGLANLRLGAYQNAIAAFGHAIETVAKQLGPDHLELASPYINLGNSYKNLHKPDDSERCYSEALRIYESNHITDPVRRSIALLNLGVACAESGRPEEAERYYEQVLSIRLKEFGRNDWRVGNTYNNLAMSKLRARDFKTAEEYVQMALEILDEQPEWLPQALETLSRIREEQGRLEESLTAMVRAVQTLESRQSPNLSELAERLDRQAMLAMRLGDSDQASACRNRALQLRQAMAGAPGSDSEQTEQALGNLDQSLQQWLGHIRSGQGAAA
jgi:tetratricopeptide (TPR) repeat protein